MSDDELRKLDAEVHAKVFGKPVRTCKYGHHWTDEVGLMGALRVPPYSKDIAAAWLVMEWLREKDCDVGIESCGSAWSVSFLAHYQPTEKTPMLAICRAALKASEETQ